MASGAVRLSPGRAHDPSRPPSPARGCKTPARRRLAPASPHWRHRRPEAADLAPSCVDLAPLRADRDGAVPAEEVAQIVVGIVSTSRLPLLLAAESHSSPSPPPLASLSLPLSCRRRLQGMEGEIFLVGTVSTGHARAQRAPSVAFPCQKRARDAFHRGGTAPTIKQTATYGERYGDDLGLHIGDGLKVLVVTRKTVRK
uniref:Uncharacterized protein n=1 Tax=Oryza sativa subsp. indica TaxID=39946 RepID=A0A8F3AF43_ORYSI|nr:hypothetical protein Xa7_IRBB7.9 [Oryza sativa Indica Group]